jgi:tetratricopeptide (TPR) repeat protein
MTTEQEFFANFQKLKSLNSLAGLNNATALHYLACLVDLAARYNDPESTDKALAWANELKSRTLSASDEITLAYYTANAWGDKQNIRHRDANEAWKWEQPETLNQIRFLRRARRNPHFKQWDGVRQAQVLTNLGNQFDTLGRFVEAIAHWNDALEVKPKFGMARGNRGAGLLVYGNFLFDPHHKAPFYVAAYRDLEFALSDEANFEGYPDDGAKQYFRNTKEKIAAIGDIDELERHFNLADFSLGETGEEQQYRKWALSERLFLNPINDLGPFPVAAADTFVLPSFTTGLSEPPTWLGFFNQLKQEYVSARWTFYEGSLAMRAHFSDRDVKLYNTLDYPVYGLGAERVKIAFRMAYSLFDKIGFFLNGYARLKIPET